MVADFSDLEKMMNTFPRKKSNAASVVGMTWADLAKAFITNPYAVPGALALASLAVLILDNHGVSATDIAIDWIRGHHAVSNFAKPVTSVTPKVAVNDVGHTTARSAPGKGDSPVPFPANALRVVKITSEAQPTERRGPARNSEKHGGRTRRHTTTTPVSEKQRLLEGQWTGIWQYTLSNNDGEYTFDLKFEEDDSGKLVVTTYNHFWQKYMYDLPVTVSHGEIKFTDPGGTQWVLHRSNATLTGDARNSAGGRIASLSFHA